MNQKGYEYVHGSAARQLVYDVYEENQVLRAKKRYKSNRKIKLRMVVAILAVFAAGLAVMCRYAIITKVSYQINQREKVYEEIRNENSLLRVQIETKTDLNEIKEIAESRLGMQMPDKSQIVYIRVPRNDYTVLISPDVENEKNGNTVSKFINRAAGFLRLFE
ncbi:MAG: cell division protein FtsL [Acetivibrionales bacterium]|nr:cell division protein FtsL [Bacillota bacterium]NLP08611.1 cell division protein FtsL [Clostridiaceae bacterium]HOA55478.1 cell division protein FtsL [Clostridiales bacterium]HQD30358.1 cell division protein FtsL [Clostridiales bacterium]